MRLLEMHIVSPHVETHCMRLMEPYMVLPQRETHRDCREMHAMRYSGRCMQCDIQGDACNAIFKETYAMRCLRRRMQCVSTAGIVRGGGIYYDAVQE